MILKDTLKGIAQSQKSQLVIEDLGVEREKLKEIDLSVPHAVIISGIRRCGKSTLLKQLMKRVKEYSYFNFEDPRALKFEVSDFERLNETLRDEYGYDNNYFFDEIQNVQNWEFIVRFVLEKKKKVFITGSNASLLSAELGRKLTGRHLRHELFPFSYKETLKLTNKKAHMDSFDYYLEKGGFPEYLKYGKIEILQELLNDIVARDIIARYKLRNTKTVKEMIVYLLSNIGKEISFNSLKQAFNLGSTNSVISFVSYFEDSYLIFTIPKFEYSLKKQLVNPKKIYSIDTGFSSANSVSFSTDKGRMLENLVFLYLRKKYKDIFYFRENNECDFVVKEKEKITDAFQVCYLLNDDNKKREIDGLLEAMEKFDLNNCLILTYNQEDKFKFNKRKIIVKPAWKWMIE